MLKSVSFDKQFSWGDGRGSEATSANILYKWYVWNEKREIYLLCKLKVRKHDFFLLCLFRDKKDFSQSLEVCGEIENCIKAIVYFITLLVVMWCGVVLKERILSGLKIYKNYPVTQVWP